ncbi:MAG: hypothetical protein QM687_08640 [Ferruginibacter sp.]
MKKILLLVPVCLVFASAMAQTDSSYRKTKKEIRKERIDAMAKLEEEGVIAHRKQTAFGLKLTTDGYGGFLEIGRAKSVKRALLFQLDISERKHIKEEKQTGDNGPYSTAFIYGKINFFYPVKLGIQMQQLLGNKGNKNGVNITANLGGGLALGLLRPYMLDVDKNGQRVSVKYESPDSVYFLNHASIYGGPGFGDGWSDLSVVPGVYVKPAVRFDYGRYNEVVSAVEVGLNAEFYSKKIPQMVYQKQKQFFFGAYVAIIFGKRK